MPVISIVLLINKLTCFTPCESDPEKKPASGKKQVFPKHEQLFLGTEISGSISALQHFKGEGRRLAMIVAYTPLVFL